MATALSWSGGKDSALALHALRQAGTPPDLLLTTFDETTGTVPHHGVAMDLLRAQAAAAGLPLHAIAIPPAATNASYEDRLRAAFARPPLDAVDTVAFGDLFLEDLRAYREARMHDAGLAAAFPLWGRDTGPLAHAFIDAGFRAILVSVDGEQIAHDLLGRTFDRGLLTDLPPTADPCGENGEFHTFVFGGPIFARPLAVQPAGRWTSPDGRFAYLDLRSGAGTCSAPTRTPTPCRSPTPPA
ncbi:adenine nucleotide alpha hydrolase [Capillimicrobium parvum]|uniref:Diphthamide synthase domain-containing protein n=1 Tax=Capillimicrobium parvum TaxID=2884022 RepID=A0A9E6XT39_9ACTN|nr:adenine nucleotide alpha hydrolase [Capillimicrobium parvum]UGS34119.1 hypothetical protein DSM104329_00490 [Capillimicrobium parvum]